MEPMTLGSPGSPAQGGSSSGFLPPFLMGESNIPTTPRNNTLSPAKGRAMAFGKEFEISLNLFFPPNFNRSRYFLFTAQSPSGNLSNSPDFNKSSFQQRPFLGFQQTPPQQHPFSPAAPNPNKSISGPPTQGLFDSLRAEKNTIHTPNRTIGFNQSFQQQQQQQLQNQTLNQSYQYNQSFNDSYLNQSGFNASRLTSPVSDNRQTSSSVFNASACVSPQYNDFWITVYGFPVTATSMIVAHFSQCGTIVDKIYPQQNGNWIHLKFSSRLECDKALNYNEKILSNSLMIGVTRCKDQSIVDKENVESNLE